MTAVALHQASASFARGQHLAMLSRPHLARYPALLFAVTAAAGGAPAARIAAGVAAVFAAYAVMVVYNDLRDLDADRHNRRDLPLATGAATVHDARLLVAGALAVLAVAQLSMAQPSGLVIVGVTLGLGAAYSRSRRGVTATVALASCYLAMPMLLGTAQADRTLTAEFALVVAGLVLLSTAVLPYKDFKDAPGDRAAGRRTPVIRWGRRRTQVMSVSLAAAATVVLAAGSHPAAAAAAVMVAGVLAAAVSTRIDTYRSVRYARIGVLLAALLAAFQI